jgi:uncharacterized protein (DUF1697 family)
VNTYISMLRGINVGGSNQIRMADLKKLYEELGFQEVVTYVNSGNVVFRTPETDANAIARRIQAQIKETLGGDVPVLIREPHDLERILAHNPFLTGRKEDTSKLHVMFLSAPPVPTNLAKLVKPANCEDEFIFGEQEIFLFCPGGLGRTKLTTALFERSLKVTTTTRNWNTVNALFKLSKEK